MKLFPLKILTADGTGEEREATVLNFYSIEGAYGIMAGHAPFFTALKDGVVNYLDREQLRRYLRVEDAYVLVEQDGSVNLLCAAYQDLDQNTEPIT